MRTLEGRVAALERVERAVSGAVVVQAGESLEQAIARSGFPDRVVLVPAKAEIKLPVTKSLTMGASHADD